MAAQLANPVEGQTATNRTTGAKYIFQNGQWVNAPTAAPGASYVPPPAVVATNAARVKEIADGATTMNSLADQARSSVQLNHQTGSGGILAVPIIGSAALGIAKQFNPALATMDSNAVNMAKSMRAQGQRLTQMEWLKNLTAVPSPKNTAETNQRIAREFQHGAALATDQTTFYQNWLAQHGGDLNGADVAWRTYKEAHYNEDNTPKTQANAPQFKYLGRQ